MLTPLQNEVLKVTKKEFLESPDLVTVPFTPVTFAAYLNSMLLSWKEEAYADGPLRVHLIAALSNLITVIETTGDIPEVQ